MAWTAPCSALAAVVPAGVAAARAPTARPAAVATSATRRVGAAAPAKAL